MSRLPIPTRDEAPAKSQPILDAVGSQLGIIPNSFRLLSQSPAALEGFLGLSSALNKTLDVKTRERIALTVAQVNGCDGAQLHRRQACQTRCARTGRQSPRPLERPYGRRRSHVRQEGG